MPSYKITAPGDHLAYIETIAEEDAKKLLTGDSADGYGGSWKKRGGIGAYAVYVRKPDRLDLGVKRFNDDVFEALHSDKRGETVLDDIRDARRYLLLIEAEYRAQLAVRNKEKRTPKEEDMFVERKTASKTIAAMNIDSRKVSGMQHPFGFDEGDEV